MHAVELRFPNKPEVYAAALRANLFYVVRINRGTDEKPLANTKSDAGFYTNDKQGTSPQALAAFLNDAESGQRLDPENAYFDIMRATALFAMEQRFDAAEAAVIAAGTSSQYEDYQAAEIRARDRLSTHAIGGADSFAFEMQYGRISYAGYSIMKDLARLTTANAIVAEHTGDLHRGFVLRRALRQIGGAILKYSLIPGEWIAARRIDVVQLSATKPNGETIAMSSDIAPNVKDNLRRVRLRCLLAENRRA